MKRSLNLIALLFFPCLLEAAPPREVHRSVPVIEAVSGPPYLHAGPMVGHVTDATAQLWAKASNAGRLSFKIGQQADLADGQASSEVKLEATTSFAGQVVVRELKPSTRYYYLPLLDGKPALPRPYPAFVTAPKAGSPERLARGVWFLCGSAGL